MPTVPSTRLSVDSLVSVPLADPDFLASDEPFTGPTPDPDTDDVVLVPVDDRGNAVSQPPEQAPPQPTVKPRIELSSLTLHSPSSIVGTPFDPSPRFEYPFPASCAPPVLQVDPALPSFPILASPLLSFPHMLSGLPPSLPLTIPSLAPSGPAVPTTKVKAEFRSFSPTHPKLQAREPPIPPGLVKKRKLNLNGTTDPAPSALSDPQGRARGGSLSVLSDALQQLAGGRGSSAGIETSRCNDAFRSQSLDIGRKRHSVVGVEGERTVGSQSSLPHSSSSPSLAQVFHPRSDQRPTTPSSLRSEPSSQ
ncbi:hypothetical protein C8Q76DRAFT_695285 [Earliella scabrosa]|nr:hypothetical protein C8Q76DRAFT_695285 [Earliella scabrosa]